jgi:phospholipid N-methyltransferase
MVKTKKPFQLKLQKFSNDQFLFVKSLLKNPGEIGQVIPSSRFLSERMVDELNLAQAGVVVEFGPGTGSVTRAVLNKLGPNTAFFAIESNSTMVSILRRRFPMVEIVHDSAEHVNLYLEKYNLGEADYIISSLPFALIEPRLRKKIIENSYKALRPGGAFVAYQYIHASLLKSGNVARRQINRTFRHVDSSLILRNFPPAFVLKCVK